MEGRLMGPDEAEAIEHYQGSRFSYEEVAEVNGCPPYEVEAIARHMDWITNAPSSLAIH